MPNTSGAAYTTSTSSTESIQITGTTSATNTKDQQNTTPKDRNEKSDDQSINIEAIVGGTAAGLTVLAIGAVGAKYYNKKQNQQKELQKRYGDISTEEGETENLAAADSSYQPGDKVDDVVVEQAQVAQTTEASI